MKRGVSSAMRFGAQGVEIGEFSILLVERPGHQHGRYGFRLEFHGSDR